MEAQVNIFNKGINSDLSPLFISSDMWVFPTVNARFYNTGQGFACVNIDGNTKEKEYYSEEVEPFKEETITSIFRYAIGDKCHKDGKVYECVSRPFGVIPIPPDNSCWKYIKDYNPEDYFSTALGAEIVLKENYNLIGAFSIGGVAFLCSVSGMLENKLEIGCFPSPKIKSTGYERVYKPLHNIRGSNAICNFNNSNTFSWATDTLLRIEGKVEYDRSVNLYICSGADLLRVVNSAFDISTGDILEHRKYSRTGFEVATRSVKTPNLTITSNIIQDKDIKILQGGELPYGTYILYFRYANATYDTTKWVYETKPIVIADGLYENETNDYISGKLDSNNNKSKYKIQVEITTDAAYDYVEVGYIYYSSDNSRFSEEKGVLSKSFTIDKDRKTMQIEIAIISGNIEDWDAGAENLNEIELVPKEIHSFNNILYQANMSNEIVDKNIIREFIQRVKLKCHVHHGMIAMPRDEVSTESLEITGELIARRLIHFFHINIEGNSNIFYNLDREDVIIPAPISETEGLINIVLTERTIDSSYHYNDKIPNSSVYTDGYIYSIDAIEYPEFASLELYVNEDETEYKLIDTNLSIDYTYIVANTYEEVYKAASEGMGDDDKVVIIDDYMAEVTLNGNTYFGFYVANKTLENRWLGVYRLYTYVDGAYGFEPEEITFLLNIKEIRLSKKGSNDYIYGGYEVGINNDAYYSKREHIMNDVGYFGGEIYAYSIIAVDKYGSKYGPFPCTGIDHYYANKISDLDYEAYEDDEDGVHYSELKADTPSPYTVTNGTRMFTKNKQGIYRFPCRANYVKTLDNDNKLIREELLSEDIEDYANDAFSLTQRLKYKSNSTYNRYNILNIFKISFDFSEAYNWLSQANPNNHNIEDENYISRLINVRNNIVKFIFLRAERSGDADNLIAQGIIQKPNTIIPYPKFYEYETLDLRSQSPLAYSHASFEKLISYNFDMIYNNCSKVGSKWERKNLSECTRHNLHGQLGNSAIKYYETEQDENDTVYPVDISKMKSVYGETMLGAKSFIYSGIYSFSEVDYCWDRRGVNAANAHRASSKSKSSPALGAISFACYNDKNKEAFVYAHNNMDWFWGEMGSTQNVTVTETSVYTGDVNLIERMVYPMQNIFFDLGGVSNSQLKSGKKNWYNYWMSGNPYYNTVYKHMGEYMHMPKQYPLSAGGGAIKIPFFKGYMPCLQRTGRQGKADRDAPQVATLKAYTTRCMYHPYDKTRAFISPDIVFGQYNYKYNIDETEAKYIKPIRKTIHSGLDGVAVNGHVRTDVDISNKHFKADCWKTFFAAPGEMMFNILPFAKHYYDAKKISSELEFLKDNLPRVKGKVADVNSFYMSSYILGKANGGHTQLHRNINPPSLLHAVRKYYKIDSPRECMPLGSVKLIDKVYPKNVNVVIPNSNTPADIDSSSRKVEYYINCANDFTAGGKLEEPITLNDIKQNTYRKSDSWKTYNNKGNAVTALFGIMDCQGSSPNNGSFIASNRSFKIIPYYALELNNVTNEYKNTNEMPSMEYPVGDYRRMRDYTNNYYDRTVHLSRFKTNKSGNVAIGSDKEKGTVEGREDIRLSIGNYKASDMYIDYNYEDLSIVNIYKSNPENIIDITDYYSYNTEMYYEIGQDIANNYLGANNSSKPKRNIVLGRGDCYLDRTYIKHTSWLPTNLSAGAVKMGDDGANCNKPILNNWEITGAAYSYESWQANFTSATSSYAHGVTIGLITENRHNIALRGEMDDKTKNAYPLCEKMPNNAVTENGRQNRMNLFLIYPEAVSGDNPRYMYMESLFYNKGYHKVLGTIFYALENDRVSYLRNRYPNRIRWSYYANEGSYVDGWREFDIGNYHDYTPEHGEIVRLLSTNNTLISFMENGILQHHMEGKDVVVSEEQMLSIGGNRLLSEQTLLLSDLGLSHKHALVSGAAGVYGIDINRKTLWRIVGERGMAGMNYNVVSLDLTKGISNWLSEYIERIQEAHGVAKGITDASNKIVDMSYNHIGVSAGYDKEYKEVLFTLLYKGKSYTICFSEVLDTYTSLYTFDPYIYFNINNNLYSCRHSQGDIKGARRIYRHNNKHSYKQHFYNTYYDNDFEISFIVNGATGEHNTGIFAKQFQALSIEAQQEPFSTIRFETKDQEALNEFIEKEMWWSHPEYNSHHWQVPIQIDNTSGMLDEDLYYQDSSMTGDWLKVTLSYRASQKNKEIKIQSILTTYYISNA